MPHLLLVALAAATISAADVTGTWTGTLTPGDGEPRPAHLVLKQGGDTVSGTAGPDASEQRPIQNGKSENGKVTFEVAGEVTVMKFVLKLEGDEMTGDVSRERDGQVQTAKLAVKRAK
jgi:hypothetical protein